jgi:hypothetical protein
MSLSPSLTPLSTEPGTPTRPRSGISRRSLLVALALTALAAIGATACEPLPPQPPGGTTTDCRDIPWGSGTKKAMRLSPAEVRRVRVGSYRCFDRMIIDLKTPPAAGWHVRYHAVTRPGSGWAVPLRGGDSLEVIIQAPAYGPTGTASYRPAQPSEAADVGGYRTFRQVAYAGSFEGETTFGIGVRDRLPFRVWAESGSAGTKLVIDVAHRWP